MYMQSLSGGDIQTWERAILLNALPSEVRTVLSNSNAANNKWLAQEANGILEQHSLARPRALVQAVHALRIRHHPSIPFPVAERTLVSRTKDPHHALRVDPSSPDASATLTSATGLMPIPLASKPRGLGNGPAGR